MYMDTGAYTMDIGLKKDFSDDTGKSEDGKVKVIVVLERHKKRERPA